MNIDDFVQSNTAKNMFGRIVKIIDHNHAIITVREKEILINLNYWQNITT